MMDVKVSKCGKGRYGARKYAMVPSSKNDGTTYTVVKVRVRNTRNYVYRCSCPNYMYRSVPCKHIETMREVEALA